MALFQRILPQRKSADMSSSDLQLQAMVKRVSGQSPFPRTGFTAISCHADTIVVFGGQILAKSSNTSEKLHLSNDIAILTMSGISHYEYPAPTAGSPPSPRHGHSAVYFAKKNLMVVFGGQLSDGSLSNDLYTFNTETKAWSKPRIDGILPTARYGHSMVLIGSRVCIFGGIGSDGKVLDDLVIIDLDAIHFEYWVPDIEGHKPPSRAFHASTCHESRLIVHGGLSSASVKAKPLTDLWTLDIGTMKWQLVDAGFRASKEAGLFMHSALFILDRFVVIGGLTKHAKATKSIYGFNFDKLRWDPMGEMFEPRSGHGACYLKANDRIIILGGFQHGEKEFNQVSILSLPGYLMKSISQEAERSKGRPLSPIRRKPPAIPTPTSEPSSRLDSPLPDLPIEAISRRPSSSLSLQRTESQLEQERQQLLALASQLRESDAFHDIFNEANQKISKESEKKPVDVLIPPPSTPEISGTTLDESDLDVSPYYISLAILMKEEPDTKKKYTKDDLRMVTERLSGYMNQMEKSWSNERSQLFSQIAAERNQIETMKEQKSVQTHITHELIAKENELDSVKLENARLQKIVDKQKLDMIKHDETKRELDAALAKIVEMEREIHGLKSERSRLSRSLEYDNQLEIDVEKYKKAFEAAQLEISSLTAENTKLSQKRMSWQSKTRELNDLRNHLDTLTKQNDDMTAENATLREKLDQQQKRLSESVSAATAKQMATNLEKENQALKQEVTKVTQVYLKQKASSTEKIQALEDEMKALKRVSKRKSTPSLSDKDYEGIIRAKDQEIINLRQELDDLKPLTITNSALASQITMLRKENETLNVRLESLAEAFLSCDTDETIKPTGSVPPVPPPPPPTSIEVNESPSCVPPPPPPPPVATATSYISTTAVDSESRSNLLAEIQAKKPLRKTSTVPHPYPDATTAGSPKQPPKDPMSAMMAEMQAKIRAQKKV